MEHVPFGVATFVFAIVLKSCWGPVVPVRNDHAVLDIESLDLISFFCVIHPTICQRAIRIKQDDSRFFGLVERGRIVGQATAIVLSREGSFLHPRWNRFFSRLN